MIVIARSYGQLGNRLFLYGHMIAAATEYGVSVANPCFAEYAHLFPATEKDLWCRYPERPGQAAPSLRTRKVVAQGTYLSARGISIVASGLSVVDLSLAPVRVMRIKGEQSVDLDSPEFADIVRRQHVFAQGWLFRGQDLMQKHADKVREHLRIAASHQKEIDQMISPMRDESDVVVGIHIRHGDYATFMDGKYFYSIAQYASVMRRLADQLAPRRVSFLVCGNAQFDLAQFKGLNVRFGTGDIIEDLYGFAEVDLLLGPPSTFTGWASFYGDVPLLVMESADAALDLSPLLDRSRVEPHCERAA